MLGRADSGFGWLFGSGFLLQTADVSWVRDSEVLKSEYGALFAAIADIYKFHEAYFLIQ
jgi:hypothetical protein